VTLIVLPRFGSKAQTKISNHGLSGPFRVFKGSGSPEAVQFGFSPSLNLKKTTKNILYSLVREPEPNRSNTNCYGFQFGCLPKIGFVESIDDYAFTFLNPKQAIRGIHLIPAFTEGHSEALLLAKKTVVYILNPNESDDWLNFYINM
jgi:hypothetical protein